ncbi:CLUMA_CG012430, isoform A [Clunio marinus]|uniref:CLUMA_CG012430, isoform A n=1 Tax=Clunio marinus TaxID=568069 RepID=A0A1J1IJV8_9DIPT|nr:CLUMA_CG012430, isoform A [Clunio marinus]
MSVVDVVELHLMKMSVVMSEVSVWVFGVETRSVLLREICVRFSISRLFIMTRPTELFFRFSRALLVWMPFEY